MILILAIALVFALLIKIFPPKKPNYLYGYSMGSAKKAVHILKLQTSTQQTI